MDGIIPSNPLASLMANRQKRNHGYVCRRTRDRGQAEKETARPSKESAADEPFLDWAASSSSFTVIASIKLLLSPVTGSPKAFGAGNKTNEPRGRGSAPKLTSNFDPLDIMT
jgi:hypothetical protein